MANSTHHTSGVDKAVDAICDKFEAAWRAGAPCSLETVLQAAPTHLQSDLFRELLALERHYRDKSGSPLDSVEALRRFTPLGAWVVPMIDHAFPVNQVGTETKSEPQAELSSSSGPTDTRDMNTASWHSDSSLETWVRSLLRPSPSQGELGQFGPYRVQGIVGKGGMGVVLRAVESKLDRAVALKLIRPEVSDRDRAVERFLREARAAARVLHPRIVPIFAVGEVEGVPFLAMPLLKGESLRKRLAKAGKLPLAEAARIACEVCEGLAAAHGQGLVHRDIKPDNVWLEATDDGTHVRLLDFGLARSGPDDAITHSGGVVGTPRYMAPEQADGLEPAPAADLFSVGCMLYEMLSGKPAFDGDGVMAVLKRVATHTPPSLDMLDSGIPIGIARLVASLLEKDPARRPASASTVVSELRNLETSLSNDQGSPRIVGPNRVKRRWRAAAAILLMGVVLSLGLYFALIPPKRSATEPDPDSKPSAMLGPIGIKAFHIRQIAKLDGNRGVDRGLVFGQSLFEARLGDQVEFAIDLTRPAHASLVALRPDGELELILPEDPSQEPPRVESLRYPAPSRLGEIRYGLSDGTGLWAFAVVASDQPMPPFQSWGEKRPEYWRAAIPTASGRVYDFDGSHLVMYPPEERLRAAAQPALDASSPIEKAFQALKSKARADAVFGQAFVTWKP